ncbi:hypothetical protein [Demetria terragena]|uniref:hypothetical protein n=1 Tax=Demetria terragena TaxID=63959 RepID=UPI0003A644C0|nr:hypothetical protein [Demetria terragena]
MNTPNTPTGSSSDDEQDPTGVRELLASLPDPGPMPDHVMNDITAALQREQQQRSGDQSNVSPLVARSHADSAGSSSAHPGRRGPTWLRPLAAVGAAAAIGIGALAGYQALSGSSSAPVANAPTSSGPNASDAQDRFTIQTSGRDYTKSGLATQAASLKNAKPSSAPAASSLKKTTLTTPDGVVTCLRSMTGNSIPDKIAVDVATFEGKPAVIVVVTEDGKSRAWVVARTCENADGRIAGPTTVA